VRETQHPRTQLAWTRTGLSLAAVGLVEVRLLLGPNPTAALWALGGALAAVVVLGVAAALRLERNADALDIDRTSSGGRAPALIACLAVLVAGLGLVAVLTQEQLLLL
jgi:uncharacterized membrane protein YidH (DUF202 family)